MRSCQSFKNMKHSRANSKEKAITVEAGENIHIGLHHNIAPWSAEKAIRISKIGTAQISNSITLNQRGPSAIANIIAWETHR